MHMENSGPGFTLVIDAGHDVYVVRWCCSNRCGGVFSRVRNRWTLVVPTSFRDFLGSLKAEGIVTPATLEGFEAQRWIEVNSLASDECAGIC